MVMLNLFQDYIEVGRVNLYSNKLLPTRKPLIIFDCDGVLVDSEPIAAEVISSLLGDRGITMKPRICQREFHGFTMDAVVQWVKNNYSVDLGDNFLIQYHYKTMHAFDRQLKPVEGIRNVLESIDNPICVASNSDLEKIKLSLSVTGLLKYFSGAVFSAEQVKQGKPSPDLFLYAAKKMNAEQHEIIVIEDSLAGVSAAITAGMHVLAYIPESNSSYIKGDVSAMRMAGATTFTQMENLISILKSEGPNEGSFGPS
tara:strand:- start:2677 stop:3444 length:768 start_codon:yes stop_codon:yes gene_type:complete